ncbi:MAG: Multidrug resistance protein MdtK [Planctomycetota bacterium]
MARQRGIVRPLVGLVGPVLVEQFLALAVGFVDKWLAGNLFSGAESLAAIGLVAYALAFLPVLFVAPAAAATALVARSVGAGDLAAARRVAAQCLLVTAVLAAVALGAAAAGGGRFVAALGLPAGSSGLAVRYLAIVLPALPLMAGILVGVAAIRGAGDMVAGLVTMSVVNLVNAGASFVLATGCWGLEPLGWEGLAWGTVAGYACGGLTLLGLLLFRDRGLRPRPADVVPAWSTIRQIGKVGMPAGVDAVGNAACHLTFLGIVNRLGDIDAAAHAVAITIESLAFLPGSAFQVAAATLSGQFLGARDERRARGSVWLATLAAAGLMSVVGLGFLVAAGPLAAWFTGGAGSQPAVAARAAELVRIVAFAQPPLALLMVLSGGLRGAGATRPPLLVNFLGLTLVRLPLAVFLAWPAIGLPGGLGSLPGCGLGARGAWLAMAADLTARGLAMLLIFRGRSWSRVEV